MLSSSKNSFKIKQPLPDTGHKSPKSPNVNDKRNRNFPTSLRCFPGEYVQEQAAHVRKFVSSRDGGEGGGGGRFIPGTLYCTNLRVAFLPDPSSNTADTSCQPFIHSSYDVALPCIGKLVAVNSFTKAKVVTSTSALKFVPEELILYCRDFRVLRFRFHESGLEPRAFRVTMAIAQAQERRDSCYENVALKNLENSQHNKEERGCEEEFPTLLFETLADWEKELKRLGATGWRVSPVNERFEMSTSLPKYLWVPSRFLDNELKRTFVHFNERRIPRLCWHHPGGSNLLRAANFHPDSDPEKEDMRSVETLMLAGHSQCVIVEAAADLPSPAEIQQSCSKLWGLCLCVVDSSLPPSDEKWLSSVEGTRWLDYVRACVRKAREVAVLLMEGCQSVVLQESDDRDLNCLLASLVQVISDPHTRTVSGFQSLIQKEWVAAGHPFLQRLNVLQKNDRDESPVFLLFLDCVWQLLRQFPQSFEFTEAYLVALHDRSYVPFFSTFLFNCQWERGRKSLHRCLNQLYTPINGWRDSLGLDILQEGGYPVKEAGGVHLPTVWDWGLCYNSQQRTLFKNPCFNWSFHNNDKGPALNGNFLPHSSDKMENAPLGNREVYLFSKGSLSLQTHFFPWKNGSLYKRSSRWAQMLDGSGEQERPLKDRPSCFCRHREELLLLPLYAGPFIHLWRRCYLRGNHKVQVGLTPSTLLGITEELDLLQERLNSWQARGNCSTALESSDERHQGPLKSIQPSR